MRATLHCVHCGKSHPTLEYAAHVVACINWKMLFWDADAYSKTYYEQVRKLSRFKKPGDKRHRSLFKSWGWWIQDDTLPIQSTMGKPIGVIKTIDGRIL